MDDGDGGQSEADEAHELVVDLEEVLHFLHSLLILQHFEYLEQPSNPQQTVESW